MSDLCFQVSEYQIQQDLNITLNGLNDFYEKVFAFLKIKSDMGKKSELNQFFFDSHSPSHFEKCTLFYSIVSPDNRKIPALVKIANFPYELNNQKAYDINFFKDDPYKYFCTPCELFGVIGIYFLDGPHTLSKMALKSSILPNIPLPNCFNILGFTKSEGINRITIVKEQKTNFPPLESMEIVDNCDKSFDGITILWTNDIPIHFLISSINIVIL